MANEFISTLAEGSMPGVIYDAAMIGRLHDNSHLSLFPNQVKAVLEKQFEDGSWGANYYNPYDRLLSTMAALHMILELDLLKDQSIHCQFQNGVNWIESNFDPLLRYKYPMPVGFEFLFPFLATEVMSETSYLNINLSSLEKSKKRKLAKIGDIIYSTPTPILFSIEGIVDTREKAEQIARFQSPNGSIATSPAATSVLVKYGVKDHLPEAMRFLNNSITPDRLVSHFNDYQYMNISFSLYPLIKADYQFGVQGLHISRLLNEGWSDFGVSFGKSFLTPDADDTAMVLLDLDFLGNPTANERMETLLKYEQENYFQTYFGEIHPALMTNLHVLEAFLNIDHPKSQEVVDKLSHFVRKNQGDLLNISKYNSSLLIQHSSVVVSLLPNLHRVAKPLLKELEQLVYKYQDQNKSISTEECAHTLLTLLYAKKHNLVVDEQLISGLYYRLTNQLRNGFKFDETYTWNAKVQYSPTQISQAHVIATHMLHNRFYPSF